MEAGGQACREGRLASDDRRHGARAGHVPADDPGCDEDERGDYRDADSDRGAVECEAGSGLRLSGDVDREQRTNSIYRNRDRSDPNAVLNTVAAAQDRFVGLAGPICKLSEWVLAKSEPMQLFADVEDPPNEAIPTELRDIFEYALRRADRDFVAKGVVPSKMDVLTLILAHAMSVLIAENSCAIAIARRELGLSDDDIRQCLAHLESELVMSRAVQGYAETLLLSSGSDSTMHLPPKRNRHRSTPMSELLTTSLTR